MTEDLARLGIIIESQSVGVASKHLDDLASKSQKAETATGKLAESWKALSSKSDAMFNDMRTQALTAYMQIRRSAESSAADIVRAEKAKNAQLKAINEEQFGKQVSLISTLKEHWLGLTAAGYAVYSTISKVSGFVEDVAKLGARYETLGVVMEVVGRNAGYSKAQMDQYSEGLQKQGISMVESRQSLTMMAQAQLDLNKATELGRVAQDAAVIGQMNSSEAYQRLIYGIQSGQIEILRTIGINVNFENSYAKVAKATNRTTASLSESEKATIRMNAVLEAGQRIAGTYEAAMGTAGKQMTSFARYTEDFKVIMGTALLEGLSIDVESATGSIKEMQKTMKDAETQKALHDLSMEVSGLVKQLAKDAPDALRSTASALSDIIAIYQALPNGTTAAVGVGIIGAILWGGPAGATMAGIYGVNKAFSELHETWDVLPDMSFGGFIQSAKDLHQAIEDIISDLDRGKNLYPDFFGGTGKYYMPPSLAGNRGGKFGGRGATGSWIDPEEADAARRQANATSNARLGWAVPDTTTGASIYKNITAWNIYAAKARGWESSYQGEPDSYSKERLQVEAEAKSATRSLASDSSKLTDDQREQLALKKQYIEEIKRQQLEAISLAEKCTKDEEKNDEEEFGKKYQLATDWYNRNLEITEGASAVKWAAFQQEVNWARWAGVSEETIARGTAEKQKEIDEDRLDEMVKKHNETKNKLIKQNNAILATTDNVSTAMSAAWGNHVANLESKSVGYAKDLTAGLENWGSDFSSTLSDMVWGADASFRDIAESFGKMITEMVIKYEIARPIVESLGGGMTSGIDWLFGSAKGNVFQGGYPVPFAKGTLITKPTLFPMANGGTGLAGEAGTEAIMPLKRLGNGNLGVEASGGAGTTVNVYNNGSNTEARVEQTTDANGGIKLDIIIDEIVAGKITGKGKTRKALQTAFNLRPNIQRR